MPMSYWILVDTRSKICLQIFVAVGFGVATPEDDAQVSKMADGVIVGSAIVKRIASHQQDPKMVEHVAEFVRSLKAAMVPA